MRVLIRMTIGRTHDNLGLAPQSVKEQDLICIIYGCSVPVVLRPVKENDKCHHVLIGECYIHGMMDGKAFRLLHGMNTKRKEFELR